MQRLEEVGREGAARADLAPYGLTRLGLRQRRAA